MYKTLLSLILLILLTINANSETNVVGVSNSDVPANEKWMLDRVLAENPDLKLADLYRVEFVAGTYYGQVNSSGVPNGHGILGTVDGEGSISKGIESNFKNGKIGKNEEPTIVSSTGETQTGAVAVEFQNRAFNNGFDVRVGLSSTLLDVLTSPEYISNTLETLGDVKETLDDGDNKNYTYFGFGTGISSIQKKLQALQDLYQVENVDLKLISNQIKELKKYISEQIRWDEGYVGDLEKDIEYQVKILEELGTVFIKQPQSVGDIFAFMFGATNGKYRNTEDDLRWEMKSVAIKKDNLIKMKDIQLRTNDLLDFGFLLNEPTDNDHELVSILLSIGQTDLKLDDIRFNVNINLRKDTTGGAIEGKINGKWYEMVVEVDGTQIKLNLTKKGKRDLAAAAAGVKKDDKGGDSM